MSRTKILYWAFADSLKWSRVRQLVLSKGAVIGQARSSFPGKNKYRNFWFAGTDLA